MGRKILPAVLVLILSILACSVPGIGTTPPPGGGVTPEPGGVTPEGVTPEVVLPPPAVAPPVEVVYAKGGNIWLWVEGVSQTQLTSSGLDSLPQLNATRSQVAFYRSGELWVVNRDGSGAHAVVSSAYLAGLAASPGTQNVLDWFEWDPLFEALWFGTSSQGEAYTIANFDLFTVSADGLSAPHQEMHAGEGGRITFSPDGQWYTLTQAERIRLNNRDATGLRDALTFPIVLTYSEWYYLPEVVWFADSSEFRAVIPAHDPMSDPFEGTHFWSVPVSGSPVEVAGFIASPGYMDRPVISPDGLNVAYMAPNGANTDLHLNGFFIGDVVYTTHTAGMWGVVGWAPDSARFVYWIDDVRVLWLGGLGAAAIPLTDTAHTAQVRWVDGARILFLSDGSLRLGFAGGTSTVLDTGVDGGYDFFAP